jgi:lactoylglutathione lyase
MTVLKIFKLPDHSLDLYFMGYSERLRFSDLEHDLNLTCCADSSDSVSPEADHTNREGVIELSYNYGTSNASDSDRPKSLHGSGYLCITVDYLQGALQRLRSANFPIQTGPNLGRSQRTAFVKDPDGYWIALTARNANLRSPEIAFTDIKTYRMNHTMLQTKDPDASVAFYRDVLGMKVLQVSANEESDTRFCYLSYVFHNTVTNPRTSESRLGSMEGLLCLASGQGFQDENGAYYRNDKSQSGDFGHIAIAVEDVTEFCNEMDARGVLWQKRLMDGPFRVAFAVDPDGYVS